MKKGYAQLICKLDQRTQRSQWSMVFTGLCHALRSTKQECEEKNACRSQHEGCNSKNHHFLQNLTRKCTIATGSKSDRGSACLSTSHASYGKQEKTCRVEEQLPIASKPKPEWSVGKTLSMWTISIEQTSGKYRHLPAYWFFLCFFTIKNKQNEEHLPPDARWYNYIGKKGYAKHFCMTCSGLAGTTLGSPRRRRWQGRGRWQGRATATWFLSLIFCLDLHLWMCRRERPWPRIGWYQVISIPKLPKPSPSHQNATSWCGRLMRRRRRNSKGGLAVRNPVPAKCSCHTGQLRYFLPPGFLLVRKTQTDRTARRFLVTMVRLAMRLHGWRWTSATSKSC